MKKHDRSDHHCRDVQAEYMGRWGDWGGGGEVGGGGGGRVKKSRFHPIVNAQLFWW